MIKQVVAILFLCPIGKLNAGEIGDCYNLIHHLGNANYQLCASWIAKAENSNRFAGMLSTDQLLFANFIKNALSGDRLSLQFAMQQFKYLDGACKEELAVTLGKNLERTPKLVLIFFVKYRFSKSDIGSVLLNFGDEYVDDLKRTQSETRKRIALISAVNERGLVDIRQRSLDILTQFDERVSRLIKEPKNAKNGVRS